MDKSSSYKLIGAPCGQHGQYTFYKALKISGKNDQVIAIGDFFFVKIWQDSELVSVGELQLLWTDRVSDQTLVSLRLYFLPENTPEGRNGNGEDEVLAINDKVVLRVEDLLSWLCRGDEWRWGLQAVWRGACAPPSEGKPTAPLHYTKLDFSDVEKEKNSLVIDENRPGVVVFSYPRYCRYRALVSRLEGTQADWLRDALVAALGGYAAPTHNTRILYCKDTFEYPELEGHEFVCNHLAPKMKGRPRGRRRRRPRSRSRSASRSSRDTDSGEGERRQVPRRLSLRNGKTSEDEDQEYPRKEDQRTDEERAFVRSLKKFYKSNNETVKLGSVMKEVSLQSLYSTVVSRGGHGAVCAGGRRGGWRGVAARAGGAHLRVRAIYERYLLPYENHERRKNRNRLANGQTDMTIDTIDVPDSPGSEPASPGKRLRTPSPELKAVVEPGVKLDTETGEQEPIKEIEKLKVEPFRKTDDTDQKQDVQLKISVKPVEKLIDTKFENISDYIKNNDLVKNLASANSTLINELATKYGMSDANTMLDELSSRQGLSEKSSHFLSELAQKLNLGQADPSFLTALPRHPLPLNNGHQNDTDNKEQSPRPLGRSSLRSVRVKPARDGRPRAAPTAPLQPDSASSSPPVTSSTPVTNFGINYPPTQPSKDPASDDEIVEVPYRPKTPEIIDLDSYPESPQGLKKKKLDILKERGLEVTAVPTKWPQNTVIPNLNTNPLLINPTMQHQILTQAQIFQMYNIIPNYSNGVQPPKVIQGKSIFGSSGPEKTVYGNPKDQFMPPPHILQGTPIKPKRNVQTSASVPQDILDLTCKSLQSPQKPAVEILRVGESPSPSKNVCKNYTLVDGKAVVGSNLEITLVSPKSQSPVKTRQPQKRMSNGQFLPVKTPTPPKEHSKTFPTQSHSSKKIPPYQGNIEDPASSKDLYKNQNIAQFMEMQSKGHIATPFIDPVYMSALYSSLAGQVDQNQLAFYRDLVANQFRNYGGLINMGLSDTPTTKN